MRNSLFRHTTLETIDNRVPLRSIVGNGELKIVFVKTSFRP